MIGDLSSKNVWILFYILCFQIININSRTSTLWKLNSDKTKIIEGDSFQDVTSSMNSRPQFVTEEDPLFSIITSTEHYGKAWIKHEAEYFCHNCQNARSEKNSSKNGVQSEIKQQTADMLDELSCGKPVNFTYYDNLVGVLNREKHPPIAEPEAIVDFIKKFRFKNGKPFDIESLEKRLKRIKKEKPKSVQLYNQLGNYWRIKGEPCRAIECFRKGLAISPHNAEILLNLAKVLFHLQYLDDAIYLTRRSLEVSPPEKGAWQQYFTLGEIFKAYGHYQEAMIHLRHSLELNPTYEPAQKLLKEMENMPATTIHIYTLVIIVCLVLGVLLVILSSLDNIVDYNEDNIKPQRNFNKAMAMRSLRGFTLSSKRIKKLNT